MPWDAKTDSCLRLLRLPACLPACPEAFQVSLFQRSLFWRENNENDSKIKLTMPRKIKRSVMTLCWWLRVASSKFIAAHNSISLEHHIQWRQTCVPYVTSDSDWKFYSLFVFWAKIKLCRLSFHVYWFTGLLLPLNYWFSRSFHCTQAATTSLFATGASASWLYRGCCFAFQLTPATTCLTFHSKLSQNCMLRCD